MKVHEFKTGALIKSWCPDIEDSAWDQVFHLSKLPFIFRHVAVMPDAHMGYGMPIGGVLTCRNVIIPNAVGVDIGCGVHAIETTLKNLSLQQLKDILGWIRQDIPVGFERHKNAQCVTELDKVHELYNNITDQSIICKDYACTPVFEQEKKKLYHQVGTLGGGNHFIEVQRDEDGYIWFMIHSGSRNFGKQVCDYYNKVAKRLNESWYSSVDPKWDLAFLPLESDEGQMYQNEMSLALEFALANRTLMANRIIEIIKAVVDEDWQIVAETDVHHNYAAIENHFGQNVMVHRKGATRARAGEVGIIPGSQGTCSYIVEGLGNPDSFMSCSHGAGRVMSRSKAKKELDLKEEQKRLDDKGILHSIRGVGDLDEATSAYKDIDEVMENQKDLVKIVHKLEPLAVVKG